MSRSDQRILTGSFIVIIILLCLESVLEISYSILFHNLLHFVWSK